MSKWLAMIMATHLMSVPFKRETKVCSGWLVLQLRLSFGVLSQNVSLSNEAQVASPLIMLTDLHQFCTFGFHNLIFHHVIVGDCNRFGSHSHRGGEPDHSPLSPQVRGDDPASW